MLEGAIGSFQVVEEELVKRFAEAEVLVTPEALEFLKTLDDPLGFVGKVLDEGKKRNLFMIEKSFVQELCEIKEEGKIPLPVEVRRSPDFKPLAKEWAPELKFIDRNDVTGKSRCKGKVEDFVTCFRDRLTRTRKLIEARGGEGVVMSNALKGMTGGRDLRVCGLVTSKRETKKADLLLEIEDEEGITKLWVGKGRNEKERACFESAKNLLLDEVVAIKGKISTNANFNLMIAEEVIWPDVPIRTAKVIEKPVSVAFISDLHVGSKLFLEKQFGSFIQWLNGEVGGQAGKEAAGKVKYLVVAGDVVDGIGIYPKQEKELIVRDIFEQYSMCAKFFEAVPDYIEVIVAPGNHDAVRRAEPQPSIPKEVADSLNRIGNVHLVGNPSMAEIEGFKTLIYHGTSLDSIIAGLPGMSYACPEKPMVELIRRRNLSPLFGENPIVPEPRDYMVIEDLPDIVHMGHVHKNGYDKYRGIVVINSGTWQARTEFQVKQGHMPSPCILPTYDLRRGEITVMDFNEKPAQPGGAQQ